MFRPGLWPLFILLVIGGARAQSTDTDAMSLWRDSPARTAIVDFVARTTTADSPDFLPEAERIAVFDNDGTLWAERPAYFQLLFALDRAREQIATDPDLTAASPYREVANGNLQALAAGGHDALFQLVFATHADSTVEEFRESVRGWLASARHPRTGRPYTAMIYAPMLELLAFLREHGFRNYIVSGGGVSFIRAWSEEVYGIPPERVIGSRLALTYDDTDTPTLHRGATLAHLNDGPGKPVAIQQIIGRRPAIAVGNSDGDFEMLRWTTTGHGPRLGVLIHHTDAQREWAYDRDSSIGRLDRGLDAAEEEGWILVNMKKDWSGVFPGK